MGEDLKWQETQKQENYWDKIDHISFYHIEIDIKTSIKSTVFLRV